MIWERTREDVWKGLEVENGRGNDVTIILNNKNIIIKKEKCKKKKEAKIITRQRHNSLAEHKQGPRFDAHDHDNN